MSEGVPSSQLALSTLTHAGAKARRCCWPLSDRSFAHELKQSGQAPTYPPPSSHQHEHELSGSGNDPSASLFPQVILDCIR